MPPPPPNAFNPGTLLTVGSHQVSIIKYISSGGFAHVYTCTIDPPFHNNTTACLKRVVVPNKTQLTLLRQEVDAMKRLRGNTHVVSYIDSHASRLNVPAPEQPQQYEVLLLMEYCLRNGLIDFMNARLTHRLTEPEILSIMSQITTGVAMCHHLHPPLIHRDIKIENVLIDAKGTYKLCDFGSAVEYSGVPKTSQELQLLHQDIMQHTTPQYRAPEMIDLSRGFPIDDKLDIWALGVFLYKLCYYTTPFELPQQRTLQDLEQLILHSSTTLRFPHSPPFSPRLQNIIKCCLREDPRRRPNALQLLQEVCLMQGIKQVPEVIPYSVRLQKSQADMNVLNNGNSSGTQITQETQKVTLSLKATKSPPDAFASIDKSKVLSMGSTKSTLKSRPKSAIYASEGVMKNSDSTTSLQDLIKQHVSESSNEISNIRKSEELDRGTLDFLRSKHDAHISSSQNTGGSIKSAIKNGLRRISTGGSIGPQRSGSFGQKRSNTHPVKQSYTGSRNVSDENLRVPSGEQPMRKQSIQRRMAALLKNSEKKPAKTASGYGKYTDTDDLLAINHTNLSANASAESLSSLDTQTPTYYEFGEKLTAVSSKGSVKKLVSPPSIVIEKQVPSFAPKAAKYGKLSHKRDSPPLCPPSLSHTPGSKGLNSHTSRNLNKETKQGNKEKTTSKKPPPKPKKPLHLQVHDSTDRRLSTSSDVSLPDLDDLEKQFSRRFPSYV
ncbi:CIC11C00000005385 [Sungouiella intermedia]|uniref:non-specific serine/threonine protein kinase n=1 Tax=Sungouiella intermedia TaxID=45354 RepID=A0A1L0BPF3_9ASCO|nr:CIC11C00000005385 [[Candida] intermedia]